MAGENPSGKDWSTIEVGYVVAEYFQMLQLELANQSFVKAEINRKVQSATGRSKGSVEFKNQNISAVLRELGMPWVKGYLPLANYQSALLQEIQNYLMSHNPLRLYPEPSKSGLSERPSLYFEPPPMLLPEKTSRPEQLERMVRKFDPAERDEKNRILGRNGESHIYEFEQKRLLDAGLPDLSRKVRWVAQVDGDGAGYDIRSYDFDGNERLLEVKTTCGYQKTPFYLSRNEHELSEERPDAFRIVRLYDFARVPKAFELSPPLGDVVRLRPESYQASFA